MSKTIKIGLVWKHCKTNTLWAVIHRNKEIVNLIGVSPSVEDIVKQVTVNNMLKKYKPDKVYKLLHGKYNSFFNIY